MRILHAPRNVANQPGLLAAALRRLGHEAEVWEYDPSPFGFPADRTISAAGKDPIVFWDTFLEAIDRFDVFHFHFARTLFPSALGGVPALWDLPIYRILGKRVFFTFHGSDCRIRRIHEAVNPWSYYRHSNIEADDARTEKTIEVIRTYADRMFVTSVDYLAFVPDAVFTPRVVDLAEWPPDRDPQREIPRILHIPSRRGTKGTELILAGIRRLEEEGLALDFRLLEGVPHAEAQAAIQAADITIDNVLTGDYELVSIETMATGGVAVANIQAAVAEAFPDSPVFSLDPNTFVDRMRSLIADVALRRELSARGRPYVARNHDAAIVARQLVLEYEAEGRPVVARTHPDWLSLAGRRTIERLEREVAGLEQEAARVRRRENALRRRLGLEPLPPSDRRPRLDALKAALPSELRLALRRFRARRNDRR